MQIQCKNNELSDFLKVKGGIYINWTGFRIFWKVDRDQPKICYKGVYMTVCNRKVNMRTAPRFARLAQNGTVYGNVTVHGDSYEAKFSSLGGSKCMCWICTVLRIRKKKKTEETESLD